RVWSASGFAGIIPSLSRKFSTRFSNLSRTYSKSPSSSISWSRVRIRNLSRFSWDMIAPLSVQSAVYFELSKLRLRWVKLKLAECRNTYTHLPRIFLHSRHSPCLETTVILPHLAHLRGPPALVRGGW